MPGYLRPTPPVFSEQYPPHHRLGECGQIGETGDLEVKTQQVPQSDYGRLRSSHQHLGR